MQVDYAPSVDKAAFEAGGLYMLPSNGDWIAVLCLERDAGAGQLLTLSSTEGAKDFPAVRLLNDTAFGKSAIDLGLAGFKMLLDPMKVGVWDRGSSIGQICCVANVCFLACKDMNDDPLVIDISSGQIGTKLPDGPRAYYPTWSIEREPYGPENVLTQFPYVE